MGRQRADRAALRAAVRSGGCGAVSMRGTAALCHCLCRLILSLSLSLSVVFQELHFDPVKIESGSLRSQLALSKGDALAF